MILRDNIGVGIAYLQTIQNRADLSGLNQDLKYNRGVLFYMSMNFNIIAELETWDKKGKKHVISHHIDVFQTPTKVSYEIMKQEDKLEAYFNWVLKSFDLDVEGRYIGTEEEILDKEFDGADYDYYVYYSPAGRNIKYIKEEIEKYQAEGYEIKYLVQ